MLRSLVVIILLASCAVAGAQGINYNYIQGNFGRIDLDRPGQDVDGDGLGIAGSFTIDENFHVYGDYQKADVGNGLDVDLTEFGVGYHTNISPNLSVFSNIGFLDLESDGGGGDDGFVIGIGIRGPVSEAVELYGGLDYIDFDSFDGETRATAGFLLSLTDTFGIGLRASLWDDVNVFQLNARLYFQ